jgi:uncharacterized protein with ParB-like and HNH nuclease domain
MSTYLNILIEEKIMSEIITAINAKPETIRTFLGNYEYVIPDYQRPYSWNKDECIRLWEDITVYFEESTSANLNSPYFLGNIVIYNESKKRYVIDGQQRLITLNLLIRALFTKCNTYTALEKIIYKNDPLKEKVITPYKIKVEHNVLGDNENIKLQDAMLNRAEESKYRFNYELFFENIDTYFNKKELDSKQIEQFVLTLIDNIIVLPIECTSVEGALTIFETINNRGMDLSDSDIFKSKLYKYAGDNKNEFVSRWNELVENVDRIGIELKNIFSHYMHVIRGKEKNVDSIVGLRKFYDQNSSDRLRNWQDVMDSLDKLVWGWEYITNKDIKAPVEVLNWCSVLLKYPNSYWEYPIMTFLHNHITKENDDFQFYKKSEFLELIKETTKYCYWKWLKFRGVNAIKDTIFKVVRDVANNNDYKKIYYDDFLSDFTGDSKKGMEKSLKNILLGDLGRGLKGICLLTSVLNEEQKQLIPEDFQIEHILPHKWDNYKYSDWTNHLYKQYFNMLGNLVILEKTLNIKSSNRFFPEKKLQYLKSNIKDVRALADLNSWTPTSCKNRQNQLLTRLTHFFIDKI